jgi:hypothetical protein
MTIDDCPYIKGMFIEWKKTTTTTNKQTKPTNQKKKNTHTVLTF